MLRFIDDGIYSVVSENNVEEAIENVDVGSFVWAKWPGDGNFYDAEVLLITGKTLKLVVGRAIGSSSYRSVGPPKPSARVITLSGRQFRAAAITQKRYPRS